MSADEDYSAVISAFDRDLGLLDTDETEQSNDLPATAKADRDALASVAEQPVAKSTPTDTTETGDTPEYLTSLLAEKPTLAEKDWNVAYKQTFNVDLPEGETYDSDRFFADLAGHNAEHEFLDNTPGYRELKALTTRDYTGNEAAEHQDNLTLIQNEVANRLGRGYSDAEFDQKMSFYVDDEGKLTTAGTKLADVLRTDIKEQLAGIEQKAKEHRTTVSGSTVTARKEFTNFVNGLSVLETPVDDEDKDFVRDFTLSGQLNERLEKLTHEDLALVAIALNPYLRAKYFAKAHYERGASEGAKRKLARQLN